jgi:two-component system chemotaxis response regulator CheY
VLIVEDDDDIREALCALLNDEGFTPVGARDGREAMALLTSSSVPDLVLLDLWMPGMNGRDFAERMRNDPRWSRVPIVLLSADRNTDEVARSIGAAGCLTKPVAVEAFLDLVQQHA